MPGMTIIMDGDGAFSDINRDNIIPSDKELIAKLTFLDGGMKSGLPSVALMIPMSDGTWIFWETSVKLLQAAAAASIVKYGVL